MDNSESNLELFENERLSLLEQLLQFRIDKDTSQVKEIEERLVELENIIWKAKTKSFTELSEFSSLYEALKTSAEKINISFPHITNSREHRFMFSVGNNERGVLVILREKNGYYRVSLLKDTNNESLSYVGDTFSLRQVVMVVNRWYIKGESIDLIQKDFPWISKEAITRMS
ncbi:MAG: hypothetical protein KF758_05475 [Anaerolineales bacterium]|nr:hypothetical protein [Anaerolineales bacterium]MBX3036346.1 hypothetical protein [Anaerolineales bacterium]